MEKRLVKGADKKIFGVCSGLGNYFEVDPTVIRIAFLLLFFGLGTGLLIYLILAVVMPSN
ncbi:MAG: PspC domain-containing protein [Chitinophagales bacterium]|jgi:phage shock protein PspC (stress-responsive transcriptional regulator)|nr:PspC domain-containing protein [Chitinophagales bacterium]